MGTIVTIGAFAFYDPLRSAIFETLRLVEAAYWQGRAIWALAPREDMEHLGGFLSQTTVRGLGVSSPI